MAILLRESFHFRSFSFWVIVLIYTTILLIFHYHYIPNEFRMVLQLLLSFMLYKVIFTTPSDKIFIITIFTQILWIVAEMFFMVILTFIFKLDISSLISKNYFLVICNISICLFMIMLVHQPFVRQISLRLIKYQNRGICFIIIGLLLFIGSLLLLYASLHTVSYPGLLFMSMIFIFIFVTILWEYEKEKQGRLNLESERMTLLERVEAYEKILDQRRMHNHENQNTLLIIKSMLEDDNSDIKVLEYIQELLQKEEYQDSEFMLQLQKLPVGGLQGIIYQKMSNLERQNIHMSLHIAGNINSHLLDNINVTRKLDYIKIVSIALDQLQTILILSKEKELEINFYYENNTLFCIMSCMYHSSKNLPFHHTISTSIYRDWESQNQLIEECSKRQAGIIVENEVIGQVFSKTIELKLEDE